MCVLGVSMGCVVWSVCVHACGCGHLMGVACMRVLCVGI